MIPGIKRITILSHGCSVLTPNVKKDDMRILSPKGIDQATERRGKMNYPDFGFAICSGMLRTLQTAEIISGGKAVTANVPELFATPEPDDEKDLEVLYHRFPNGPLRTCQISDATGAFMRFVINMANQISEKLQYGANLELDIQRVLIIGHGVYVAALGESLYRKRSEVLGHHWIGECEGVSIFFTDSGSPCTLETHFD